MYFKVSLKFRIGFQSILILTFLFCNGQAIEAQNIQWKHLATDQGDIPLPWKSTEQTAALIADLDKDGLNDFVMTCRKQAPAIVWYQRKSNGWTKYIVEDQLLSIEAGGVAYDIDGDGDLDLVFGGDSQSSNLWWWENPYPQMNFHWKRHLIKSEGSTQHHDQAIGKLKHDEKVELVFWNQGNKTLYMAEMPGDRKKDNWEYKTIYRSQPEDEKHGTYVEGTALGDIDGDGYTDIIAGMPGSSMTRKNQVSKPFILPRQPAVWPQANSSPGRHCKSWSLQVTDKDLSNGTSPQVTKDPVSWIGHDLAGRNLTHGHSLQVADINGDGNLDIFVAEMAKWTESKTDPDNPAAEAFIFTVMVRAVLRKPHFPKSSRIS